MRALEEIKTEYAWQPGMGEISGFGGTYEDACHNMLWAGIAWLETKPDADLKASTYSNIYGILNAESDDCKDLEKAVLSVCSDCTGAMHQAVMSACLYISANGWAKYVAAMSNRKDASN
jgi:hypothetical protein